MTTINETVSNELPADGWYTTRTGAMVRSHNRWYVCDCGNGGRQLYTQQEWDSETPGDFAIEEDGRVTFQGESTWATVADLVSVA